VAAELLGQALVATRRWALGALERRAIRLLEKVHQEPLLDDQP
jgi:hypothetical protein